MKKLLKILFSLFFSIILLFAFALPLNPPAGNWYQQFLPNLNGRTISDITFIDSLTGWAVTPYLAVNDTSFVLKTSNGGDDWFIQHTRAGQFVGSNKVYFLNANTGFTAGVSNLPAYSAILKTTDGGNTWSNVNPPTDPFTARDISILNSDTLWVVSDNSLTGGVFFTSNGGGSWQQQFSGGNQNPNKIYMYNARIGFMSNNSASPNIYKTTNSGVNWNLIVNGQYMRDVKFIDSLTGWYSFTANVYKTTNGGNTWQTQVLPFGGIIITTGIDKFSVFNEDTLYGSGGTAFYGSGQFRGIIYRTIDGGENWLFQVPDTSIHIPAYRYIQFVNPNNGWAYSTGLGGIHTTNGGDTTFLTSLQQVSNEVPEEYLLYQNYPNPFNPGTIIKYSVLEYSHIKLSVYDITGRHIIDIADQNQSAGTYEVDFSGSSYASGVYFYVLYIEGKKISTKKMLLIK